MSNPPPTISTKKRDKERSNLQMSVMYADGEEDMLQALRLRGPPPPVWKPKSMNAGHEIKGKKGVVSRLQSLRQGGDAGGERSGSGSESFVLLGESSYLPALNISLPESTNTLLSRDGDVLGSARGDNRMSRGLSENLTSTKTTKPSTTRKGFQESGIFQRELSADEKRCKEELLRRWNEKEESDSRRKSVSITQEQEQEEEDESEESEYYSFSSSTNTNSLEDLLKAEKRKEDDRKANDGLESVWGMEPSLTGGPGLSDGVCRSGGDKTETGGKGRSERRRMSATSAGGRNGKGGFRMGSLNSGHPLPPTVSTNYGTSEATIKGKMDEISEPGRMQKSGREDEEKELMLSRTRKMSGVSEHAVDKEEKCKKDLSKDKRGYESLPRKSLCHASWSKKSKEKKVDGSESDVMPFAIRKGKS